MAEVIVNEKQWRLLQTKVTRKEEEFGHSYWSDDYGWLVGVTTLLDRAIPKDKGLIEYFKRGDVYEMEERLQETSAQGTRVHKALEQLLEGEKVPLDFLKTEKEKKCVASFIEWFRIWQPQNSKSEQVVAYILKRPDKEIDIKYAGTLDLLCQLDGKWTVIDFKTGRQNDLNHGIQIRSYGEAVKQSYGIEVEKYFTLYLGTQHTTNAKTTNSVGLPTNGIGWRAVESDFSFDDVVRIYDYAMFLNKGKYPNPPLVRAYPSEFQLLTKVNKKGV